MKEPTPHKSLMLQKHLVFLLLKNNKESRRRKRRKFPLFLSFFVEQLSFFLIIVLELCLNQKIDVEASFTESAATSKPAAKEELATPTKNHKKRVRSATSLAS